jgi:2-methylisocitrate lyase-like PEP mutase family enzyme
MMTETYSRQLKNLLAARKAIVMPGAANALTARIIAEQGFDAVYISGGGIANTHLGLPDIGLVSLKEVVDHIALMRDVVDVPLLVDGDTGFGNAVNVVRTIEQFEKAGASGIQLEDQVSPKKCGHFSGQALITTDEMVQKIKAAADSRRDQDFQIVARTDACAVSGLDAALDRAQRYIEAGADATFVEAPTSVDDLARIARELSVPQVANMVFGGKTPLTSQADLEAMGFGAVLYANAALQVSIRAIADMLTVLRDTGSLEGVADQIASFEERQRLVNKDKYDALEQRYAVTEGEQTKE